MIKIGVLGAGHLGKIHLKLLQEIPDFRLVGFYDPDPATSLDAAEKTGAKSFASAAELLGESDAIDIVTPTVTHFSCAENAMKQFRHVFIEKPVTSTPAEAQSLLRLAREANVKVQVGHVERFNPAFLSLKHVELRPMFIEVHRLAQWNPRGTDVSVVLDLMIHDIDIVLNIVKSPVKKISASGVAVISDTADIANARLEFNNGCVANMTASRISLKNMRKLRLFQKNAYITMDFLEKKSSVFKLNDAESAKDIPALMKYEIEYGDKKKIITYESPKAEPVNSIKLELEEFAAAIRQAGPTSVTLEEAAAALDVAHKVAAKINKAVVA